MSEVSVEIYNKAVRRAINRAAPRTLFSAGAYLRKIAYNSIKRRSNQNNSSRPGTPPHHHTTFKNTIRFALSPDGSAVYIGPAIVSGGLENAGRLHEFGGTRYNKRNEKKYHIGGRGPISGTNSENAKFIRLRTALQVARAERVAKDIYPWLSGGLQRFPARPYMRPALMAGLPRLSKFWHNVIKP